MLCILLDKLVDDKKQQFDAVSLHPLASPLIPDLSSYSPLCKILSITLHYGIILTPTASFLFSVH